MLSVFVPFPRGPVPLTAYRGIRFHIFLATSKGWFLVVSRSVVVAQFSELLKYNVNEM